MTFSSLYLICLVVGFVMSLLGFVTGLSHLSASGFAAQFPHFHLHLPFHHQGGGVHHSGLSKVAWFNFSALMAFLAWFGGAGLLMTVDSTLSVGTIAAISVGSGVAGATLVNTFLVKVLIGRERPLLSTEVVGALGMITIPIRDGGTGEIVYSQEEIRRSAGARSEDGLAIPKGTPVVVTKFERGIAYVRTRGEILTSTSTRP